MAGSHPFARLYRRDGIAHERRQQMDARSQLLLIQGAKAEEQAGAAAGLVLIVWAEWRDSQSLPACARR